MDLNQFDYRLTDNALGLFLASLEEGEGFEDDFLEQYSRLFDNDPAFMINLLFYIGDNRFGGLGNQKAFDTYLEWTAQFYPKFIQMNMSLIPYFANWESIFVLKDTPCSSDMIDFIKFTLKNDIRIVQLNKTSPITLIAKSLPETGELATFLMEKLGLSEIHYLEKIKMLKEHIEENGIFKNENIAYENKYSLSYVKYIIGKEIVSLTAVPLPAKRRFI